MGDTSFISEQRTDRMRVVSNLFLLAGISKAQIYSNGTLSQAEMDAMLESSCQGDTECLSFLNELAALELGGLTRTLSEESLERLDYLRRLKNLKMLVLHLQPEHRFTRYCHYGCYCLTEPLYTLNPAPNKGAPRDPIDAACKVQNQCYECAAMDHPSRSCTADRVQYSYTLNVDPADPNNHEKKSITCTDDPWSKKRPGQKAPKWSCRRSMCECDKRLAEQLREHFSIWDDQYSTVLGDTKFDTSTCVSNSNGLGGDQGQPQCCGDQYGGARFPYNDRNGQRGCCGQKTYDTSMFTCCGDQTVMGSC